MNKAILSQVVRSFLPELAIGTAVCAAGYFFLVDPLVRKAACAQAEVDALTLTITKGQTKPVAVDPGRTAAAERALACVEARSALASNQAKLLQAVSTLADSCNVRVEQFNPATARGPRTAPGQSPPKTDKKIEQRTAFSISLSGSYADTARFVRSMQQEIGFTAVRALHLSPAAGVTAGVDTVSVVIDTEHVAVNAKALAAGGGDQPAPPPIPGQQATVPTEHHQ